MSTFKECVQDRINKIKTRQLIKMKSVQDAVANAEEALEKDIDIRIREAFYDLDGWLHP